MRLLHYATQYDLHTFNWLQQHTKRGWLVPLAKKISWAADGYLYSFFVLHLIYAQQFAMLRLALIGLGIERALYFVLKNGTRRNRPPEAIPGFESCIHASDKFSFPSGHTSAAFLLACFASLYAPILSIVLFPWACCVACSRVILGVHFPTDTVAGATLGCGVAWYVVSMGV